MRIDRNNYEEYFVLYMDNELPAHERRLVEEFVHSNPDLEEELVMLQQSKLFPDHSVVFERKNLLMKEENNLSVDVSNYEEYLILYIDNELTVEERTDVEKFIFLHPAISKEFQLLQQTRLQPEEEIVFPDKSSLYKREDDKRVVPIRWWKVAIAAAVIFAAGITTFVTLKKNSSVTPRDITIIKKNGTGNTQVLPLQAKENHNPTNSPVIADKERSIVLENKKTQNSEQESHVEIKKDKKSKTQQLQTDGPVVATVNLPEKTSNTAGSNNLPERTMVDVNTGVTINKKPSQQIINKPRVTPVDTTTYNQTEPVYASNDESKNKKLRGFFRKAARIFERATNIDPANDDNKLLVGSFAINLK